MIGEALPDIPRIFTACAEWGACLVYILLVRRTMPKWRVVTTLALGLAGLIGVQYLAGIAPPSLWILGMISAATAMFVLVIAATRLRPVQAGYFTARAFVVAELLASLHWQLAAWFGQTDKVGTWEMSASVVGVYGLGLAVIWALERRHFPSGEALVINRPDLWSAVALAIVTFSMSNLSFVSTHTPFSGRMGPEIFYIRTLVDLCGFVALYAQQERLREVRTTAELASINATLHSQHEQYLQSKANLEAAGRTYHDLKHQIAVIRREVDPARTSQHFEDLEDQVRQMGTRNHTGNAVLDIVLTTKAGICAEHGITFTPVADGSLLHGMASMDIATIFGNALDNAIEAAQRVKEPEKRLIRLALYSQAQMVIIRVENYFDGPLTTDEVGDLKTTKRDTGLHGFGVKSIRFTARKYGGEVTTNAEDHWFTLSILLPHRPHQ